MSLRITTLCLSVNVACHWSHVDCRLTCYFSYSGTSDTKLPLVLLLTYLKNNNKKVVTLSVCKALWGYLDQKCHRSAKCCYYSFVFNYTNSTVLCLLSDFSNKVKKSVYSEKVIQRPFNDLSPVSHYADRLLMLTFQTYADRLLRPEGGEAFLAGLPSPSPRLGCHHRAQARLGRTPAGMCHRKDRLKKVKSNWRGTEMGTSGLGWKKDYGCFTQHFLPFLINNVFMFVKANNLWQPF